MLSRSGKPVFQENLMKKQKKQTRNNGGNETHILKNDCYIPARRQAAQCGTHLAHSSTDSSTGPSNHAGVDLRRDRHGGDTREALKGQLQNVQGEE